MQMFVLIKMAPDTVEELTVAADGKSLDGESLRFKLGDSDEHALEQALLLKERHGGTVTVVGAGRAGGRRRAVHGAGQGRQPGDQAVR